MSTAEYEWVEEFPGEILVCDRQGILLEMNAEAEELFKAEGGTALLGTNVLDCHPEPSRTKLIDMLKNQISNAYTNHENSQKRFFFQAPWTKDGIFAGFVEISFEVPEAIPHFIRG